MIKLRILQEISNIIPQVGFSDVVTTMRKIATNVIVPNSGMIVLGGLLTTTNNERAQQIPLLGDLPLFGNLFRYKKHNKTKQNLMVFIRPTIINTPQVIPYMAAPAINNQPRKMIPSALHNSVSDPAKQTAGQEFSMQQQRPYFPQQIQYPARQHTNRQTSPQPVVYHQKVGVQTKAAFLDFTTLTAQYHQNGIRPNIRNNTVKAYPHPVYSNHSVGYVPPEDRYAIYGGL